MNRRRFLAGTALSALPLAGCASRSSGSGRRSPSPASRPSTPASVTEVDPAEFTDPSNWAADAGSVEGADRDGEAAIHVTSGPDDDRALAIYEPPAPLDLSSHHLVVAYQYAEGAHGYTPTFQLTAPDWDNVATYRRTTSPGKGWITTGLSVPDDVSGQPDLSRITRLGVTQWTGGKGRADVYLRGLAFVPRPETGRVVFTFDDNRASVWDVAREPLREHDFQGSVATIPWRVGAERHMTEDQLTGLHDEGWDVVSHPQRADPLPAYSAAEQEQYISEARTWLREHGFERGSRFIVYPYSGWDQQTVEIASRYHDLGFRGDGATTWRPPDPLLATRVKGDDAERVRTMVDRLATYGGVVPLMYHAIDDGDWISASDFRAVVEHVAATDGVQVSTVSEWYDRAFA